MSTSNEKLKKLLEDFCVRRTDFRPPPYHHHIAAGTASGIKSDVFQDNIFPSGQYIVQAFDSDIYIEVGSDLITNNDLTVSGVLLKAMEPLFVQLGPTDTTIHIRSRDSVLNEVIIVHIGKS